MGVESTKNALIKFKSRYVAAKIPFPPLAEQRRIVAKVEQLMALVDALEQQLAASRATAANLLSALVAELTAARPPFSPLRLCAFARVNPSPPKPISRPLRSRRKDAELHESIDPCPF